MKCPKCGSVILPGNEHCEKCGHHFTQVSGDASGIPPLFQQMPAERKDSAITNSEFNEDQITINEPEPRDVPLEMELEREGASASSADAEEDKPDPQKSWNSPAWQSELAERVQDYRQRRARLGNADKTDNNTLDFDFEPPEPDTEKARHKVIEFPSAEELSTHSRLGPKARSDPHSPDLEDLDLTTESKNDLMDSAARTRRKSAAETGPLEIELEASPGAYSADIGSGDSTIPVAPISRRFLAGIFDALVLLSGAGIFGLIFWQTGGHFSLQPLALAVGGMIGVSFIFLYFAGCTALASATPGLIWSRLEVRTFEGNPPRFAECFWRAFGYIVSGSALMLGFIWSAVDPDGLTWHDRMSRTFVTPASQL